MLPEEFQKHTFEVPKTARFYATGSISPKTKNVWIVLHGYGQLASYFIRHFTPIANDETVVFAVEGLSRFYLQGTEGRIGATWMTREDRLVDIDDYIRYLDLFYEELERIFTADFSRLKVTVLGFSQGGATATRWIQSTSRKIDNFILWCGIYPPDMAKDSLEEILQKHRCCAVYGLQDPYLTEEREQSVKILENKFNGVGDNLKVWVYRFEGGHVIDRETLKKVALELNS